MAMARHVGLEAHYVLVERDYAGRLVSHACAGVYLTNRLILVDPAYKWFGVAHKNFKVLNDRELVGFYLICHPNTAMIQAGLKLCGPWGTPYFLASIRQFVGGNPEMAERHLEEGLRIESESWQAELAQAVIAIGHSDLTRALKHLEKVIELNPDYWMTYYWLGDVHFKQRDWVQARENYRICVQLDSPHDLKDRARALISQINETLLDLDKPMQSRASQKNGKTSK
jgi:tetratricopeptide (TPR) repeat protein